MITQTINGNEILLVTVPEYSLFYVINNDTLEFDPNLHSPEGSWETIKLPYYGFSIIGKASDMTEQQWQEVVECHPNFDTSFQDYNRRLGPNAFYSCITASESGLSLLASNNLDPKTTLVIVKK